MLEYKHNFPFKTFSNKTGAILRVELECSSNDKAFDFFNYSKLFEIIRILGAEYSLFDIPLFVFDCRHYASASKALQQPQLRC